MTLGRGHWLFALSVALLLHLSLLLAVLASGNDEGAKAEGEQGIEVDLGMLGDLGEAAETVEETVVDPQHDVEQELPVEEIDPEALSEQLAEPEPEIELPPPPPEKQKPVVQARKSEPPEPKPEQIEPKQREPKPRELKQQPPEVRPVVESAPVAEANLELTRSEQAQAAQSKASTGRGNAMSQGGEPAAKQSWFAELVAELARHKRYPAVARRRGQEGIAKITFLVNRKGEVLEYRISESSGFEMLDKAVIDMLLKARPLPVFPDDMEQDDIKITLPVEFSLQS